MDNKRLNISVILSYRISGINNGKIIEVSKQDEREAIDKLYNAVSQQPKAMAVGIPVYCAHDAVVSTDTLKVNHRNPHQHPPKQVELLGKVIRSFGWRTPITVSTRSGLIVRGHCRLLAAQLEGLDEVPVDYQDYPSDDEEYADLLADNRLVELAEMDRTMLADLLSEINTGDLPIDLTGYTEKEYRELIASLADADAILNIEDDTPPEPPAVPFTEPGDVWIFGDHVLICGDSTKPEIYSLLMDNERAQLCVTDPPYNVDYTGATKDHLKIQGDKQTDSAFKAFLLDAYTCMHNNMEPGAAAYIFHADTEGVNFRSAFVESGFMLKQCLVWVKNIFVLGRQDYQWRHEPILYGWIPGKPHYFINDRSQNTVIDDAAPDLNKMKKTDLVRYIKEWTASSEENTTVIYEDKPLRNADHPTMKPVRLVARLVRNSSRQGDIVLDPFSGSGSTMAACEQLHRRARCIEMDPRFCDVIVKRYIQISGKTDIVCMRSGIPINPKEYQFLFQPFNAV